MAESLSVVIIAKDAASELAECLQSVAFADDVVVVDSGSRDTTAAIARDYDARIIQQEWLGFGRQKQFAVTQAKHDWVLSIDVDECVSEPLRKAIESTLQAPQYRAYRIPRCNFFMGRWLRHGEGYPDWVVRLFDRRYARWSDDAVHEKVVTEAPIGSLKGDLLHKSYKNLDEYLHKQNRYTNLQAERAEGRRSITVILRLIFSPPFRFFKFYIMRLGILDGVPGLVHVVIGCMNSFLKYAKIIERR